MQTEQYQVTVVMHKEEKLWSKEEDGAAEIRFIQISNRLWGGDKALIAQLVSNCEEPWLPKKSLLRKIQQKVEKKGHKKSMFCE